MTGKTGSTSAPGAKSAAPPTWRRCKYSSRTSSRSPSARPTRSSAARTASISESRIAARGPGQAGAGRVLVPIPQGDLRLRQADPDGPGPAARIRLLDPAPQDGRHADDGGGLSSHARRFDQDARGACSVPTADGEDAAGRGRWRDGNDRGPGSRPHRISGAPGGKGAAAGRLRAQAAPPYSLRFPVSCRPIRGAGRTGPRDGEPSWDHRPQVEPRRLDLRAAGRLHGEADRRRWRDDGARRRDRAGHRRQALRRLQADPPRHHARERDHQRGVRGNGRLGSDRPQ